MPVKTQLEKKEKKRRKANFQMKASLIRNEIPAPSCIKFYIPHRKEYILYSITERTGNFVKPTVFVIFHFDILCVQFMSSLPTFKFRNSGLVNKGYLTVVGIGWGIPLK